MIYPSTQLSCIGKCFDLLFSLLLKPSLPSTRNREKETEREREREIFFYFWVYMLIAFFNVSFQTNQVVNISGSDSSSGWPVELNINFTDALPIFSQLSGGPKSFCKQLMCMYTNKKECKREKKRANPSFVMN